MVGAPRGCDPPYLIPTPLFIPFASSAFSVFPLFFVPEIPRHIEFLFFLRKNLFRQRDARIMAPIVIIFTPPLFGGHPFASRMAIWNV